MADGALQDTRGGAVLAALNYMIETGEKPVTDLAPPGERLSVRTGRFEEREVLIHDARPEADRFTLEENGFAIVRHDTAVGNFYDDAEIERVYYPEIERLLLEQSGASRVHVFDHTIRVNDDTLRVEQSGARAGADRAQRLYRQLGAPARPRPAAGRSRGPDPAPLRHHAGMATDRPAGREDAARDLRCDDDRRRTMRG